MPANPAAIDDTRRRTRVSPRGGGKLRLTSKPGAVVVQTAGRELYTLDGEGRLFAATASGATYRRGFDNRVIEKRAAAVPGVAPWRRGRRTLPDGEAHRLLDGIYERLRHAQPAPTFDPGEPLWPGGPHAGRWWDQVRRWDAARLASDADRFRSVYAPIGMLPPDMYLAVVVQATIGCSYNHCTFCDFYRGQPFRVRSDAELAVHLDAVGGFFGAALAGRRWVFCGEGNALALPEERLASALREVAAWQPVAPPALEGAALRDWMADHPVGFAGMAGFLDVPGGRDKRASTWARLRALGLRRVHIGLETGHEPLRRFLRKPGGAEDLRRTVRALRTAGVDAALIAMIGVGGRRFAEAHVRDTLGLLAGLGLGTQDTVYLSPLVDRPRSEYGRLAADAGVEPLDEAGTDAQYRSFVEVLRRPGGPRVAVYDIGEFVY